MTLGVRRVRRHRQHRGTVAYYGERLNSSGALKVRRVERHIQRLNITNVEPSEAVRPRFLAWVKSALDKLAARPEAQDVVSNWGKTQVEEIGLALYSRVRVAPRKPDGSPHPHAGKTGTITRFQDDYPAAMVQVDTGIEPQGFICVSLECLELLGKTGNFVN
jgi:hypothetical protein